MKRLNGLHPADFSKAAIAERANVDAPHPDFEIDAQMLIGHVDNVRTDVKVRAEVSVELAPKFMWNAVPKLAEKNEAVFNLNLRQSLLDDEIEFRTHATLSYWITFSQLAEGKQPNEQGDDYELRVDKKTREAMLVWWDQHGEKVVARQEIIDAGRDVGSDERNWDIDHRDIVDTETALVVAHDYADGADLDRFHGDVIEDLAQEHEVPFAAASRLFRQGVVDGLVQYVEHEREVHPPRWAVETQLEAALMPAIPCGLNADWSVPAWYLGAPIGARDEGANRTDRGIYLLDTEGEMANGVQEFALVRQRLEVDGVEPDEQVEQLASGSLEQMIARAPQFLRMR